MAAVLFLANVHCMDTHSATRHLGIARAAAVTLQLGLAVGFAIFGVLVVISIDRGAGEGAAQPPLQEPPLVPLPRPAVALEPPQRAFYFLVESKDEDERLSAMLAIEGTVRRAAHEPARTAIVVVAGDLDMAETVRSYASIAYANTPTVVEVIDLRESATLTVSRQP